MTTKFNVSILKDGSESQDIFKAIASHNGGQVPLSLEDFISWGQFRRALYPLANKGLSIDRMSDEPNEEDFKSLRVTEDGGKTFTLIIQEVELHELTEDQDKVNILSGTEN